jgi:hypothetical protein
LPPSKPLEGVTVEIFGVGLEYKGVSDNNGKVPFTNVPAGEYFLRCSKAGYITTYEHVMSDIASNCTLDIRPTVVTWSTCNAMLGVTLDQTKSLIMGSVQDSKDNSFQPFSGATVTISPNAETIYYLGGGTATSTGGQYCIYNLPVQKYTLTAVYSDKTFNSITLDLTKFGEAALYFPEQFTAQKK